MNIFPKSTHWDPLATSTWAKIDFETLILMFLAPFWPQRMPKKLHSPSNMSRRRPKRSQWAPKRKPRGCQTAINTWGNAWSRMKNEINTWGSCMSGHLEMRFGTQLKIKSENAIFPWGNHIYWAKKWINTGETCMSGNASARSIFKKDQKQWGFSLFQGVQINLS